MSGCAEEDYVADDCEGCGEEDVRSAFVGFLGDDGYDNSEDCSECIGRDGEKLSFGSFVTEGVDDGWEEEGECVEGERHGVEPEAVEPAFVIAEGGDDVGP